MVAFSVKKIIAFEIQEKSLRVSNGSDVCGFRERQKSRRDERENKIAESFTVRTGYFTYF